MGARLPPGGNANAGSSGGRVTARLRGSPGVPRDEGAALSWPGVYRDVPSGGWDVDERRGDG
jgi:hypothetical protein